jgi:glycosyltransferase involved in cell wall biosynthesis
MMLRVLCLDIEGGFGGSSRSLYESLRHMDRAAVAPEVWCRRDGPVRGRYEAIGVACRVAADMPHMNSLVRFSRNLVGYTRHVRDMLRQKAFRADLLDAVRARFDLVHFNHEGLFLLAAWLRGRHAKAQTLHVRTMIPRNTFGRWQCRRIAAANDRLVFITENERGNLEAMLRRGTEGAVIHNIADAGAPAPRHPAIPHDARLKVALLSNYAWIRGNDRMIEVAEALAARGRRDILFVVAGDMALRGTLPGELGAIARRGGTLADYAAARGVADMFLFLGHVAEPEAVLAACDVLAKPTRVDNPWGRDILEGLGAGKPVISIGHCDTFVETGATGFLMRDYDPGELAEILLLLDADRGLVVRLGATARARIASLCDGPSRARDLVALWREAVSRRTVREAA